MTVPSEAGRSDMGIEMCGKDFFRARPWQSAAASPSDIAALRVLLREQPVKKAAERIGFGRSIGAGRLIGVCRVLPLAAEQSAKTLDALYDLTSLAADDSGQALDGFTGQKGNSRVIHLGFWISDRAADRRDPAQIRVTGTGVCIARREIGLLGQ